MFSQIKKVLILSPHPDDAEFGLGATISKMIEMGIEINVSVFSNCNESTPEGFEVGTIENEMYNSLDSLGIKREQIKMFDFKVRNFPHFRQGILETLVILKKELSPDMVFLPCSSDIHQDHKTIHEEGLRAFKNVCLLGYEMPWNNFGFTSYVYINIEQKHLENKIKAINLYKSQNKRSYSSYEFIKSLAIIRGNQIQAEIAESFEMIRYIHK